MHGVEVVYTGRDNHIQLELRENGINLPDYAPIMRVLVSIGAQLIDSDINPELLDWSGNSLIIKAGLASLPAGKHVAKIETWDTDNSNGLLWTEALHLLVRA